MSGWRERIPLVWLLDGAGARGQELMNDGLPDVTHFLEPARMSGTAPQVSVVPGPCAGDAQRADEPVAKQQEIEAQFKDGTDPFNAAARVTVHDVIEPNETRRRIRRALALSRSRRSQQPGPTARYGVMP